MKTYEFRFDTFEECYKKLENCMDYVFLQERIEGAVSHVSIDRTPTCFCLIIEVYDIK